MASILRRILAVCVCAVLLAAPFALAQEDPQTQDDGYEDFFTDFDALGDEVGLDNGGEEVSASPAPSEAPAATSQAGTTGTAKDITGKCDAKVSEGNASTLADRKISTTWTTKKSGAKFQIKFPSAASGLYIEWGKECTSFTLLELDKSENVISTRTQDDTFPCLKTYFDISSEAVGIRMEFPNAGASIAEIYVLSGGLPSSDKQMWEAPHENAELLIIASIYGDEFLYFGGMLPYYQTEKGISTQVVFVTSYSREAKEQALSALWAAGIRNYPIFLDYPYKQGKTQAEVIAQWGQEVTVNSLVTQIRKLSPSVVVTNAENGEKNDGTRAAVSQLVQEAVVQASSSEYDPISLNSYGTWQVQKLYLHLSEQNSITMDWNVISSTLNNASPLGVAKNAYAKYTSLTGANPFQEGGQYDNSKFGLVFTDVGEDTVGGDLFENVNLTGDLSTEIDPDDPDVNRAGDDTNLDENLEAMGSMLTGQTDPDPTPEPTPEPTPTAVPSGFSIREDLRGLQIFLIVLLVLALLIAGGLAANIILKKRGIDLQIYRRVNRVLHGKSFRLPPNPENRAYRDDPDESKDDSDDDEIY